ncbi:MAG: hypothetical protein LBB75_10025 [Oscillospiraceae bacterium]|jgi:hypothetical protein|nr:hypothetical protein [Oscillospiraceae bacterium]
MRKLFAILLCASLAGLYACGQAEPLPKPAAPVTQAPSTAAPTAAEPPILGPIECPASYKAAPEAYWPILDGLYRFVYAVRQDNLALATEALDNVRIPSLYAGSDIDDLGYAVADINHDGIPELVILRKASVLSLHTLKEGKPVFLLGDWGSRTVGRFTEDGTLYTQWSGGGGMSLCSYRLKPGADKLTQIEESFFEFMFDTHILQFRNAGGEGERSFTDEEYRAMYEEYNNPSRPMRLDFIPIA